MTGVVNQGTAAAGPSQAKNGANTQAVPAIAGLGVWRLLRTTAADGSSGCGQSGGGEQRAEQHWTTVPVRFPSAATWNTGFCSIGLPQKLRGLTCLSLLLLLLS